MGTTPPAPLLKGGGAGSYLYKKSYPQVYPQFDILWYMYACVFLYKMIKCNKQQSCGEHF